MSEAAHVPSTQDDASYGSDFACRAAEGRSSRQLEGACRLQAERPANDGIERAQGLPAEQRWHSMELRWHSL